MLEALLRKSHHDVDPKKCHLHMLHVCVYAHQNVYIRLMLVTHLCKWFVGIWKTNLTH
jgi:hypothetical protein